MSARPLHYLALGEGNRREPACGRVGRRGYAALTPDARYVECRHCLAWMREAVPMGPSRSAVAHAAGWDAGDRSMRAAGRRAWGPEDYAAAARESARLLGDPPAP